MRGRVLGVFSFGLLGLFEGGARARLGSLHTGFVIFDEKFFRVPYFDVAIARCATSGAGEQMNAPNITTPSTTNPLVRSAVHRDEDRGGIVGKYCVHGIPHHGFSRVMNFEYL